MKICYNQYVMDEENKFDCESLKILFEYKINIYTKNKYGKSIRYFIIISYGINSKVYKLFMSYFYINNEDLLFYDINFIFNITSII